MVRRRQTPTSYRRTLRTKPRWGGGARGGKDGDQGEYGATLHAPDAEPGARVPGVASYTASGASASIPAADRVMPPPHCGLPARGVLCAQAGRGPRGGRGDVGRVWAGLGATAPGLA